MEDDINECEDEHYYDPTLLTFQIEGNIMFNGGLKYLCKQQEFTGTPMRMALKDYDVVISVVKRTDAEMDDALAVCKQPMCKHSGNCTGEDLIGNFPECYDPKNDSVAVNPGLRYCRAWIYPGTNEKLTCTNEHGLEQMRKRREQDQDSARRRQERA